MRRYKEAVDVPKKSITIQPSLWMGHFNLGLAYIYLGNKEMSIEEYKILKRLNARMSEKLIIEINN